MSHYRLSAAILSATLIVGGLYFYEPPKPPPKEVATQTSESKSLQGVGIVDIEKIRSQHLDNEELEELRGRQNRLKLELQEVMQPVFTPNLPEIDEKPFEDSAREKLMQELISQMSDLKAKQITLTEQYRKATEEEYLKRRNAVRDIYFNEALNITLKLQNAKSLKMSQEEFDALQARLEEIVAERNQMQKEMREGWINAINEKVTEDITAEYNRLKSEYDAVKKQMEEETAKKIREVNERNQALTEAAREIDYRQNRRQEIYDELNETAREIDELENKIFDAIINETGRLAAMLKLQMIFAKQDEEIQTDENSPPLKIGNDPNVRLNSQTVVFAAGGITDLTDDVIKALKLKGILR
ncbi:MAG: hypothetical protein IKZ58_09125 [Selenomonadaceae bacterium]|nr:hypothetical protein [Selenomonadaceae bacterium]